MVYRVSSRLGMVNGYFGDNHALQMTQQCRLHLISKLCVNTALYFPSTLPYAGRRCPRIYGERFNPQEIDTKYRVSTETQGNITTEVYQVSKLRHKKFPDPLNVVCILKTHLLTEKKSHLLLFSSDLALDAENANLSMFMVNGSAKLLAPLRLEHAELSVLDLKARYRGVKYWRETLKILPQKPDPIVIDQIAERLGAIGAIHHTPAQLNTS